MEKTFEVEIKGVSPLLMHKFSAAEEEEIKDTKRKSVTTKENDVNDTMYKLPTGEFYQPSESIKQSLIAAGKAFKKGKSNLSSSFASFVLVEPEAIIHLNQKWVTDRRAVVIPSTKGRVMRNRGRFNEWGLKFTVTILDSDEISEKMLHDALNYAGHYLGIGDYRPQKKGMFGRFLVVSVREVKE